MYRLLCVLLICSIRIHSQTMLSGIIDDKKILEPSGNPYIVTENITIKSNTKVTINAGCIFLFPPFSGIVIEGSLAVNGAPDAPVVFTSSNDTTYAKNSKALPNPFDWNGILVTRLAGNSTFLNVVVSYSVYGIKSSNESIVLENAIFKNNGQFNFTVGDQVQPVIENLSFNYKKKELPITTGIDKNAHSKRVVKLQPTDANSAPKIALPIATGATGFISGVAAVVSFVLSNNIGETFKDEPDPVKQKTLSEQHNNTLTLGIVTSCISAVCLPLSTTLFIKNKKQGEKTAFVPSVSLNNGIILSVRF